MRHLLIKTDTEFTPTASMSISQASKNLGDLVFIKIILIIKGDTMCAQSWLPTQAEEMMISTITGEKPGLEARRRQRGTCDHQSIIEHEHRVKTGPGLLYPGLIRCSSGDWGIMMERPPDISHTRSEVQTSVHWSSHTKLDLTSVIKLIFRKILYFYH